MKYNVPNVSVSSISTFFCSKIGPVSNPSSGQKMDKPVSFLPDMIGQFIELGPLCNGSKEGWYCIVPKFGELIISIGTISVTKAITHKSTLRDRNVVMGSGSRKRPN